jgi:hypothetical protein
MASRVKSGLSRHSSRNKVARKKRAMLLRVAHGVGVVILESGYELAAIKTGRPHGHVAGTKRRPEAVRFGKLITESHGATSSQGQLVSKLREMQKKTSKIVKKENTKLDLSNITIVTSARPSRESEIIHQYFTLRKYREFNKKKEDFQADYERTLIERYEQLDEKERDKAYELLEKEYHSL